MKKFLIILIALCAFLPAAAALAASPAPGVQPETAVWPQKAGWIGQQATIVPAKLNASSSYLLIFRQPGQDMSGIDQLFLARKYVGHPFTVEGLYKLEKKGAVTRYFWQLTGKDGVVLWVRDYPDVSLTALPFALASEIEGEKQTMAEISALVGATIWIDRNYIPKAELTADVDHLAPLTVTAFKSTGPFSETYALSLRREDGTPVVWTVAPKGTRAAFSNEQFYAMLRSGFMRHDPKTLFPHWTQTDWQLVKGQEIRVGWEREKVIMSWGEPRMAPMLMPKGPEEDMYESRYGKYHLYFKNNKLMKIKIPDPAFADKKPDDKTAPAGKPLPGDKPAPADKPSSRDDDKDKDKGKNKDKEPKIKMIEIQEAKKEGR